MPYTMEDFRREVTFEYLEQLTPEERREYLQHLPPAERLGGLTPKQILQHLSEDDIRAYLAKFPKRQPEAKPKKSKRRSN